MKHVLKNPYIRIHNTDGTTLYGGNQKLHADPGIQTDGCGPLAAADLLSYMEHNDTYEKADYDAHLVDMIEHYFPFKVHHGTSGFIMQKGLNRYFKEHGIKRHATWGVPPCFFRREIARMLDEDLPVIISVGPRFPGVKAKHVIPLYQKDAHHQYVQTYEVKSHYMVVTGMNREWLKLSSWGEVYYMRFEDYLKHAVRKSFYFFTNIIRIR